MIKISNGKVNALVIISMIIGASGLGLGIFSIVSLQVIEGPQGEPGEPGEPGQDGAPGLDGVNGTLNNVIGLWESIKGGPGIVFYMNFSEPLVYEGEFFFLFDYNSTFELTKVGWYRFSLRTIISDLVAGNTYAMFIEKNTIQHQQLAWYDSSGTANDYMIDTFAYVYSDGDDVFKFLCYHTGLSDSLEILTTNQVFNQLVLEYVKE